MNDFVRLPRLEAVARPPLRLKRRLAITFAGMVAAGCLVAAALLFVNAQAERRALRVQAMTAAAALSFAFDQEVAVGNALLKGLSTSPAIKQWDAKALYDQFSGTPVPAGSWLIVSDLEGQLVNTAVPFGEKLPKLRDFPTYPEALNRVRDRGWTVSGRMGSILKPGTTVIALGLRVNNDDGSMKGFISTLLAQDRLGTILMNQALPEGWRSGLYDRKGKPIVTLRGGELSSAVPAPAALESHLATANLTADSEGMLEGSDDRGTPVLVAFRSSGATNWTSAVAVPMVMINRPVAHVLHQMIWPAALLLLTGAILAYSTARHVERPLNALSRRVAEASGEVLVLSEQLLALQEDERQRIARELHDSTAQSLVAASLGLLAVERQLPEGNPARQAVARVAEQIEGALQELRVFSYLLHPPRLADVGLKSTLEEFIAGFAERTGLRATVKVPSSVDDLSPDLQRSVLRVVQEALANVHRHAGARTVAVAARIRSDQLIVQIRDNGHGLRGGVAGGRDQPRLGVGIPGMRARLVQFGGTLRIRSGRSGTTLLARVPLMRDAAPSRIRV